MKTANTSKVRLSAIKYRREVWTDDYIGAAEALIHAGIIEPYMVPGTPLQRNTRAAHFTPEGKQVRGGNVPTGSIYVSRSGKRITARITVPRAVGEIRLHAFHISIGRGSFSRVEFFERAQSDKLFQNFIARTLAPVEGGAA